MKKAELDIVLFNVNDIVSTSGGTEPCDDCNCDVPGFFMG